LTVEHFLTVSESEKVICQTKLINSSHNWAK
jgi:hypothetical protein